jgi:hypothetical protein
MTLSRCDLGHRWSPNFWNNPANLPNRTFMRGRHRCAEWALRWRISLNFGQANASLSCVGRLSRGLVPLGAMTKEQIARWTDAGRD